MRRLTLWWRVLSASAIVLALVACDKGDGNAPTSPWFN